MIRPPARRRVAAALLAGAAGAALALASWSAGGLAAGTSVPVADGDRFPITIDTAYGEITVDEQPTRIVALSGTYVELLVALGEQPAVWADYLTTAEEVPLYSPWMVGLTELDPDPSLFTADYEPSAEAIAALEPDLILTTIWQTDEQLHRQLSQIAPTYVGIDPVSQTSWQDNLAALAALTGHDPSVVGEVQADLDADFAAAAERLAGLQGATFYMAATGDDATLWLTEYANEPITGLGLVPGDGQPVSGEEGLDPPRFSQENADQLTADVVFIVTKHRQPSGEFQAALEADPRVAALPAAQNGTLVFFTAQQWFAVNGGTPASYTWWLEGIVPVLEDAALNQRGQ